MMASPTLITPKRVQAMMEEKIEVDALPHYPVGEIMGWTDEELRVRLVEDLMKFQPIIGRDAWRDAWTDRYGYGYYVGDEGELELLKGLKGLERKMILPDPVRVVEDTMYLERVVVGMRGLRGQFVYASVVNKLAMMEWKKNPLKYDPNYLAVSFVPELRARAMALMSFGDSSTVINTLEELIC